MDRQLRPEPPGRLDAERGADGFARLYSYDDLLAFGLPRAVDGTDARGRLYADGSGFLSVDPLIQSPAHGQRLNPYSYVFNNPFAGIDPTGNSVCNWIGGRYLCMSPDKPGRVEGPFFVPTDEPSPTNGQQGQGVGAKSSGPSVEIGSIGRAVADVVVGVAQDVAQGTAAVARFVTGVIQGFGQGVTESVTGTVQIAMHPVVTLQSLAFAVRHPVQVAQAISAEARKYERPVRGPSRIPVSPARL